MWSNFSVFIFRNRHIVLIALLSLTGVFGYYASQVRMTYNFPKIIPDDNPSYVRYLELKETFGEDGSIMVIGIQSEKIYDLDIFQQWKRLGDSISKIEGITNVISPAHAFNLVKDTTAKKLFIQDIYKGKIHTQSQVDSIWSVFSNIPIYNGLLFDSASNAMIMAVTFERSYLDSEKRLGLTQTILDFTDNFESATGIEMHHSGLPFMRSYNLTTIRNELIFFLILAVVVLGLVLLILFRSLSAMIFPIIVVGIGAIWSMGSIAMMGYKITILTGLLPTLIVVIGIPNCIYLLNKLHSEYRKHRNLQRAVIRTIEKVGAATFFTNLTTAIGFGVFYFTDAQILQEFGLVAFLDVMAMFFISLVGIPVVLSYFPEPTENQLRHLDRRSLETLIQKTLSLIQNKRKLIYGITGVVFVLAVFGLLKLESKGYMLDDVPEDSKIYKDLSFFEKILGGVLPFEVVVSHPETKKMNSLGVQRKLAFLSDSMGKSPILSKGFSSADGARLASFAYYEGDQDKFKVPSSFELANPDFRTYVNNTKVDASVLGSAFTGDSGRIARVAFQMANIGSDSLPIYVEEFRPLVDSLFPADEGYKTEFSGTTIISLVGFQFLIDGLFQSVILSFILIAIIMGILFKNMRMLIFALIPNILPLVVTAGIMGWAGIPLKPSTVLIFSIAFGISVDYSIHFLSKYKQELQRTNSDLFSVIQNIIKETGVSMIYTSLILFFGFIVFAFSEFQGTANMGILTSIALFVSLFSNLLFLPCILIGFDTYKQKKLA